MMEAGWPLRVCCEKVLVPLDYRDVTYTKTRLRTPSTNQSSNRSLHCKKFTRTADCFIGRHSGTGRVLTRGFLCLLEPYEGARLKDIWDRDTHYVYCP
ncbi:hypothetical protein TNCV_2111341 [Trichonephila clavipes]|nr:hypothetical protein TNCV_2111341 [Trichonephila clavipes]